MSRFARFRREQSGSSDAEDVDGGTAFADRVTDDVDGRIGQARPSGRPGRACHSRDRGVSDTVGFVLVFALVTATISVVFVGGFSALDAAQEAERDANVERAFDVLADNVDDIDRRGVPSRGTEIQLAGGTLQHGDGTRIEVNSTEWNESVVVSTRPIVYSGDDTEIVYEAGAVVRSDGDSSVMLSEPNLVNGSTVILPIIDVGATGQSVGGERTVLVVADSSKRGTVDRTSDVSDLTVSITSPRADAWERYFDRLAERGTVDSVERDDDEVSATFDGLDRGYVMRTEIDVRFA